MQNIPNKKCDDCSIKDCLHNIDQNIIYDQPTLTLKRDQVPIFFDFYKSIEFDGQVRIVFNNNQQQLSFFNFIRNYDKSAVNDKNKKQLFNLQDNEKEKSKIQDFEQSFINVQEDEDSDHEKIKKQYELKLQHPFNYMLRIPEFLNYAQQIAKSKNVELTMNRKQNAKLVADSESNVESVQNFLNEITQNCDSMEVKKQRWEAIAINNTRSIISKLNQEKIGYTKVEESHEFFKLYFFWKKKESIPDIINYIKNSSFVSIKIIKNKKIQKANLNQEQNKLMNTFSELKTKLFQNNFQPSNEKRVNFEMKIDDKNQIFNRFIYHYMINKQENQTEKEDFKMNIDLQINSIVYFGLIVKNSEFNPKKRHDIEFSSIEKIGNFNVVSFAFDMKKFNQSNFFNFLNYLDIYGMIFDNFKWKLTHENIQDMKSFNLKDIKFVSENKKDIQLQGLTSDDAKSQDFWKRILFFIMDMSEKNQKSNKSKEQFEFSNFNNAMQQINDNNNQKYEKEKYQKNNRMFDMNDDDYINFAEENSNDSDQKFNDFEQTKQPNNQVQKQIDNDQKNKDYQKQQIDYELIEKEQSKKQYFENLFDDIDTIDQGMDLQSTHLKFCGKQDQERIQLQLRQISKVFQIVDIYKNFNQDLFESYNDLKEQHDILDVMEKQYYTFSNQYKGIVENGFQKGHKFYQSLDNQLNQLKDNNYVFICHVLVNEEIINRQQDMIFINEDKIAFPTFVVKLDRRR